jgi:hypothetical protein
LVTAFFYVRRGRWRVAKREQRSIEVSRRLFEAVKLHGVPAYKIARQARIEPSILSKLLHGAERVRPQDPRVLAIARIVGVPPEDAFDLAPR